MKTKSLEEFKLDLKEKNLLEYKILNYKNMSTLCSFICPNCNSTFQKTPKNFLKHQCNYCKNIELHNRFKKTNFKEQAQEIFPDYDFSKTNYYNNETKVVVICPKHGEFEITPNNLLNKHGCRKCADELNAVNKTYTLEELINRAKLIFNNKYDYSLADKIGINSTIQIKCPEHGLFQKTWNNHLNNKQGCPFCKLNSPENIIANYLIENNIKFNHPYKYKELKDIDLLSYDFYLPDYNLLIEFNGEQHYQAVNWNGKLTEEELNSNLKLQQKHDKMKKDYAEKNNINLLIVPYWEKKNMLNILEDYLNG